MSEQLLGSVQSKHQLKVELECFRIKSAPRHWALKIQKELLERVSIEITFYSRKLKGETISIRFCLNVNFGSNCRAFLHLLNFRDFIQQLVSNNFSYTFFLLLRIRRRIGRKKESFNFKS